MWKIVSRLVLAAFLSSILYVPTVYAAVPAEEKSSPATDMASNVAQDDSDDRGSVKEEKTVVPQRTTGKTVQEKKAAKEKKKKKQPKARYVQILADDNYTYFLDTESMRYIPMPHSGTEKILDVWVRLFDTDNSGDAKAYSYPKKYYLEHYYIRPEKQQIQFLCELEVTGRPENTIQERPYSAKNWENLVPGSIEDDLYRSIMTHVKKDKKSKGFGGIWPEGMSVRDALEEYARISL